jgi:hypothetical protein
MSNETLAIVAGSISSMMFMTGTMNMVVKAWRTRDMQSYSIAHLVFNNVGNLLHWLYVTSLPPGPIYLLHTFYTLATIFMLVWALLYQHQPQTTRKISQRMAHIRRRVTQTLELPRLDV